MTSRSEKRKAGSPVVSKEKESRLDQNMENDESLMAWAGNPFPPPVVGASGSNEILASRRGSATSHDSYSTVTSRITQRTEKKHRESVFVTKKPEGAFRDEIVVELQTLDDQPFRGTITFKEAREVMFNEIMGFSLSDLYSVRFRYNGCPVVRL